MKKKDGISLTNSWILKILYKMKKIKYFKSQISQKQLSNIIKEQAANLYLIKEIALINKTSNFKQHYFQTEAIFKTQTAIFNR